MVSRDPELADVAYCILRGSSCEKLTACNMIHSVFAAVSGALAFAALGAATQDALHSPFTAKDMLQAPRPGPPLASPDGRHAIQAINEYSFRDSK